MAHLDEQVTPEALHTASGPPQLQPDEEAGEGYVFAYPGSSRKLIVVRGEPVSHTILRDRGSL